MRLTPQFRPRKITSIADLLTAMLNHPSHPYDSVQNHISLHCIDCGYRTSSHKPIATISHPTMCVQVQELLIANDMLSWRAFGNA